MIINPVVYSDNRASDIFSSNLESRVIHLVGEVTDEMAATVVAQLLHLSAEDPKAEISLYINSPGGSVSAGLAIYDTMRYIPNDVATVCLGCAASMGAVILAGGAHGKRSILPHSEVMIHQPSGGTMGQATDFLIAADAERDHWLKADEALKYGLVDKVLK